MSIHEGLAALRVRQDADPIFIHDVCRQVLKEHLTMGDPETRLLKCDACDQVIGEWSSEADMRMELQAWSTIMNNPSMKTRKQRFSPGRRVMVGMGMKVGTVKTVADHPSVLGEFVHEVLVDGENEPRRVVGCDLQPLPGLDEDLHKGSLTSIHLENSSIFNLNLGTQVGTINAVVQVMQGEGDTERRVQSTDMLVYRQFESFRWKHCQLRGSLSLTQRSYDRARCRFYTAVPKSGCFGET